AETKLRRQKASRPHVRLGQVEDGHAATVLHREHARRAAEPAADVEYPGLCGRRRETREPLRRRLATPVKVVRGCDVVDGESANILTVAGQGVEDGFAQPLAPPVLADYGGIRPADHGIHDVLLARSLKPSGLVSAFPP